MSNYFTALSQNDVSKYVEKKGRFSYLSWTYAVQTLKKAHPDSVWEIKRDEKGQPFFNTECGYFVEVAVTVEGITHSQIHPVLNGANKPIASPNAFEINTSIQRCLVKAIALHGLGLYIYAGEDLPEVDDVPASTPPVTEKAPNAREIAHQKALSKRAEAELKTVSTPPTDGLPFDEQTPVEPPAVVAPSTDNSGEIVEPINPNQIKAIGNMLKMLSKKKAGLNEETFLSEAVATLGKSQLEDLSYEEGKTIVTMINQAMRTQ